MVIYYLLKYLREISLQSIELNIFKWARCGYLLSRALQKWSLQIYVVVESGITHVVCLESVFLVLL